MAKDIQRQVAYKLWINDIITSDYIKQEGWNPNYIEFKDKKVSRVNLVATVVSKYLSENGNYGAVTLDDGTETIRVKAFGPEVSKVADIKVGDIVQFIGKIKEYQEEKYLTSEVLRRVDDPNWILVRKIELKKPKISLSSIPKPKVPEKVAERKLQEDDESISKNISDLIRKLDAGEGAQVEEVMEKSGMEPDDAKNIIIGLLKAGDVYEPKKGKLKLLD